MKLHIQRPEAHFVAVPNFIFGLGLSPDAIGVLCFIMSHHQREIMSVAEVRDHFKMGKDKWQRIRRELADVGALQTDKGGHQGGENMRIGWPGQLPGNQREPGNPAAGKPGPAPAGNPAHKKARIYKDKEKEKKKGAVAGNPPADPAEFSRYKATARPQETLIEWRARQ